jgi:hypothetical protein
VDGECQRNGQNAKHGLFRPLEIDCNAVEGQKEQEDINKDPE